MTRALMSRILTSIFLCSAIGSANAGMIVDDSKAVDIQRGKVDAGQPFAFKVLPGGRLRVSDYEISNTTSWAIHALGTVTKPTIVYLERTKISNTMHGVWVQGNVILVIQDCEITNWLHWGVAVLGTADAGPRCFVDGTYWHDPSPGLGGARYPFFASNLDKVCNVRVTFTRNKVIGPGEPFDRESSSSRGTADQISLYYCCYSLVGWNLSEGGGENGGSCTLDSHHVTWIENAFRRNCGHGVQAGSDNGKSDPDVQDISLIRNVCTDNGQSPPDTIAAVYTQDSLRTYIAGHEITDQTGKQLFGINVSGSRFVTVGGDNTIRLSRTDAQPIAYFRSTISESTVTSSADLLAAVKASKPYQGIVLAPGQHRLTESITIGADHVSIFGEGAEIISTASRIIAVRGDGFSCYGLKVTGHGKGTAQDRQTGFYSDWGRAGLLDGLDISKVTECVKLDRLNDQKRGADNWRLQPNEYRPIGMGDGTGYGIICGPIKGLRVTGGLAEGVLGKDLRHGLYLSGGASECEVVGFLVVRPNHAGIACYSKEGQPPCRSNAIRKCFVWDQARGANDSGAIEIDGNCLGHVIDGNEIAGCQANAILINSLGLNCSDHTITGNTIERIGLDGIRLMGAVKVGVRGNSISAVSQGQPGQRAPICIVAWYQSAKKVAARDITVGDNDLDAAGARELLTLNPTPPKPINVTWNGKVLAP